MLCAYYDRTCDSSGFTEKYLAHDTEELDRQKMVILIPFQVLRLRSLLDRWKKCPEEGRRFNTDKFYRLRDEIRDAISLRMTPGSCAN